MSELWLPAATALAALTLTYLCCVRPMWRAHRGAAGRCTPDTAATDSAGAGRSRLELTAVPDDPAPVPDDSAAPRDPRAARGG